MTLRVAGPFGQTVELSILSEAMAKPLFVGASDGGSLAVLLVRPDEVSSLSAAGVALGSSDTTGDAASDAAGSGLSGGMADVDADATSEAAASGQADGMTDVAGSGAADAVADGAAQGQGGAQAFGEALQDGEAAGGSSGTSGAAGTGEAEAESQGSSQGGSDLDGELAAEAASQGGAGGSGSADGAGASEAAAEGLSEGEAAASGASGTEADVDATGASAGEATVTGAAAVDAAGDGTTDGQSTVAGDAAIDAAADGAAGGTATVVGTSVSGGASAGQSDGSGDADGTAAAASAAAGTASSSSSVVGAASASTNALTAIEAGDQDRSGDVVMSYSLTANATVSLVLTASATPPSEAQVLAGQDHTGATALASYQAQEFTTDPGVITLPLPSGLDDVATWAHAVISGTGLVISTPAPVVLDTVAPVLSAITGVETGETTAIVSFTVDEPGEYTIGVWADAAEPTPAEVQAGTGSVAFVQGEVTAAGTIAEEIADLTAGTDYKVHVFFDDTSGQTMAAESATFTTDAVSLVNASIIAIQGSSSSQNDYTQSFSVVAGNTYLVFFAQNTEQATLSGLTLNGIAAAQQGDFVRSQSDGVVSAWLVTADTTGVVDIVAQGSGGTNAKAIGLVNLGSRSSLVGWNGDDQSAGFPSTVVLDRNTAAGNLLVGWAFWNDSSSTGVIGQQTGFAELLHVTASGDSMMICLQNAAAGGAPETLRMAHPESNVESAAILLELN